MGGLSSLCIPGSESDGEGDLGESQKIVVVGVVLAEDVPAEELSVIK